MRWLHPDYQRSRFGGEEPTVCASAHARSSCASGGGRAERSTLATGRSRPDRRPPPASGGWPALARGGGPAVHEGQARDHRPSLRNARDSWRAAAFGTRTPDPPNVAMGTFVGHFPPSLPNSKARQSIAAAYCWGPPTSFPELGFALKDSNHVWSDRHDEFRAPHARPFGHAPRPNCPCTRSRHTARGHPGRWNAITDVAGVEVGATTLIRGSGRLTAGRGRCGPA